MDKQAYDNTFGKSIYGEVLHSPFQDIILLGFRGSCTESSTCCQQSFLIQKNMSICVCNP